MGRISEHSIQKVAEATDIVDLIGARVPLKRAGASFRGLCPFHKEKSPSFHVSPQKQSYHCFGCGAGGSVFQFLMEYEGMDFLSAVRLLADKAGIRLEEDVGGNDGVRDQKKILLRIHEMAAEWFHQNLLRTAEGQVALEYLNKRGLGGETIRAWQLGYAPAGWDALLTWAKTQR
ncbi:MAG: CHC2 zinc finger domain-containing protein, partial [Verrucomicrobiales bacterium]